MGIKGITDRGVDLPEIFRIRKGESKKDAADAGRAVAADLDYFRLDFAEGEEETQAAVFALLDTEEPAEIPVWLPFETERRKLDARTGQEADDGDYINPNWVAAVEAYVSGGCVYRSDGERVEYWIDPDTGMDKVRNWEPETACAAGSRGGSIGTYTASDGQKKKLEAKPYGRLSVMLRGLPRAVKGVLVTHSIWDIMRLSQQMNYYISMHSAGGVRGNIQGIPFVLRRKWEEISTPGAGGKRVRRRKSLVVLEVDEDWVQAKLQEQRQLSQPGASGIGLLEHRAESLVAEIVEGEVVEPEETIEALDPETLADYLLRRAEYYGDNPPVPNDLLARTRSRLESLCEEAAALDVLFGAFAATVWEDLTTGQLLSLRDWLGVQGEGNKRSAPDGLLAVEALSMALKAQKSPEEAEQ